MSRSWHWMRLAVVGAAAGLMWVWGASLKGGIGPVLLYSMAAAATGMVVGTTSRLFAMFPLNRATITTSGLLGILFLTPILAVALSDVIADTGSSVVLLISAIGVAAMAGALWGLFDRAREAFAEWRDRHPTGLITGGAH